jgi:uncharacterized RDD family membrane protein YckC
MYCTHCGQSITEGATSCQACGQAVQVAQTVPTNNANSSTYHVARLGQRFADYVVDLIVIYIILFMFALVSKGGIYFILSILISPIYYIVTESMWQRTVGKFVTGTKVVTFSGEKPEFWQIVGRSFARWIPFEAFSFFGGGHAGWHDTLAETLVVPNEYSPEQVRQIDLVPIRNRKHTWIIIAAAAFVVIAIIGILSAIVLASLSTARERANEARAHIQESSNSIEYDNSVPTTTTP